MVHSASSNASQLLSRSCPAPVQVLSRRCGSSAPVVGGCTWGQASSMIHGINQRHVFRAITRVFVHGLFHLRRIRTHGRARGAPVLEAHWKLTGAAAACFATAQPTGLDSATLSAKTVDI